MRFINLSVLRSAMAGGCQDASSKSMANTSESPGLIGPPSWGESP